MIGLLLVSHVKQLADGLKRLLEELGGGQLVVVTVGGEEQLGVSVDMVLDGIHTLQAMPGITEMVALGDLGNSLICLDTAVELESLEDDLVVIDAPFIEGAVAAAMAIVTGADRDVVVTASHEAYTIPKR